MCVSTPSHAVLAHNWWLCCLRWPAFTLRHARATLCIPHRQGRTLFTRPGRPPPLISSLIGGIHPLPRLPFFIFCHPHAASTLLGPRFAYSFTPSLVQLVFFLPPTVTFCSAWTRLATGLFQRFCCDIVLCPYCIYLL